MKITTVLFDLDGTLLPMDQDQFVKAYFGSLTQKLAAAGGYDPQTLTDNMWKGIVAMMKNDGSHTNKDAFWKVFSAVYGAEKVSRDTPLFDAFYANDFDAIRRICGYTPKAAALMRHLEEHHIEKVLATNPIFPAVATEARMRWAGLSPSDFRLYTTYENARYSKPNPAYYRDILDELGTPAEACLMVGNDVDDDMPAETLGMKVFLLTDCLINRHGRDISRYPQGGFDQLTAYIDSLL